MTIYNDAASMYSLREFGNVSFSLCCLMAGRRGRSHIMHMVVIGR
jgi:hypothetical protein